MELAREQRAQKKRRWRGARWKGVIIAGRIRVEWERRVDGVREMGINEVGQVNLDYFEGTR